MSRPATAHKTHPSHASQIFAVSTLRMEDTQAVKAIADAAAKDAKYAAYYYAMLALFMPDSSTVVRNGQGDVTGASIGMYDFNFQRLIVSHLVTALADDGSKEVLVRETFARAARHGAEAVEFNLDTPHDADLASSVIEAALEFGLAGRVIFNDGVLAKAPAIVAPAGLDTSKIVYRHAKADDAFGLWHLVKKINKESGGLDIYALSNYQRLCRDFSETCTIAEIDGQIVGFATGYRMPDQDRKGVFLWQTGVHPNYGGKGIATVLENMIIDAVKPDYLNFSVEASNGAANKTAAKKAQYMGVPFANPSAIPTEVLGGGHEAEVIYYVGQTGMRMTPPGLR
ncbi:MAG: GNAT family N-acetyltransferase [Proteobacteria bacterium]|nr:GNAT family N-acetyltransferase [Pseudomonadota bacterium]